MADEQRADPIARAMRSWARPFASRRFSSLMLGATVAVTLAGVFFASQVEHDDDLLAFLPEHDPDVAAFHAISRRFGSLEVAIVGIEAKDPFASEFLEKLRTATKRLNEEKSIHFALSLANVQDFTPSDEGGIETDLLVNRIPADATQRKQLAEKVMSRELVVGQLVSQEQDAVLIYCFAAYGTDPKDFAATVKRVVSGVFPSDQVYWGGAPFISTYIYGTTQEDLHRLTPWAVLVKIVLLILFFWDWLGGLLSLLATSMGIAMTIGAMGLLGADYDLVLSSLPVILFSLGSAYPIHILMRYYAVRKDSGPRALEEALGSVGPTILASGLTTVVSLLSFLAMDIAPMRRFGLFSAIGVASTLLLTFTFVPAVISLAHVGGKRPRRSSIPTAVVPLVDFARLHPRIVTVLLLAVCLAGGRYAISVDNRMDQTALFSAGSPPERADRFLLTHFGGSTFIQVHTKADFAKPEVLRELVRTADRIEALDSVSNVQHVGQVIAELNLAMEGSRRIPDDEAKVRALYGFLAGDASLGQLVTEDRTEAVMVVKVRSTDLDEIEATLSAVERIVSEMPSHYRLVPNDGGPREKSYVAGRIERLLARRGIAVDRKMQEKIASASLAAAPDLERLEQAVLTHVGSDEFTVDLEAELETEVAHRLANAGGADRAHITEALRSALSGKQIEGEPADEALISDLAGALETPLAEIWRNERSLASSRALLGSIGLGGSGFDERIAHELQVLSAPTMLLPSDDGEAMAANVNGLPVLHRALSRSSTRNQLRSFSVALLMVIVVLSAGFWSVKHGLLAVAPTVVTLLVVCGGMSWLGIHLDIGTSMLPSLIIGAGVDYAVHFVAVWKRARSPWPAVEHAGPAIWTNAVMVAAGFFVLTLGEARPLQNVGGLTSAAMLVAALSTFIAIPIFGGRLLGGFDTAPDAVNVPEDSAKGTTP